LNQANEILLSITDQMKEQQDNK